LTIHAERGSSGFDCFGCDHVNEHDPIDPAEWFCCLDLIAEIFNPTPERARVCGKWVVFDPCPDMRRQEIVDPGACGEVDFRLDSLNGPDMVDMLRNL
jgi:hypothetical protein